MSDIVSIGNKNSTKKSFLDNSRPLPMISSDQVYKKISLLKGGSVEDTLETANSLLSVIKNSRSFNLDQIWKSLEKKIYGGKSLSTTSKTDIAKFQTAFGLFYNMLETIDTQSTNSYSLVEYQNLYLAAQNHVTRRILPGQTGKDLRNLERTLETINQRLSKVKDRFNALIDAGEMSGPKL